MYLHCGLHGHGPNCKILQPFHVAPTSVKKAGHWRGRWSMTGGQLAAWFFVWGGLQAEFPSQLCLVSLHAGSGLCCSRLLHAASAPALQRAVSFLISARRLDNTTWNTGLTTWKGFCCCCFLQKKKNTHTHTFFFFFLPLYLSQY